MSIFSDFSADYQFERDYPFGVPCETWTTRDGRQLNIGEMSERHIRNCMCMVGEDDPWYARFQRELDRRGLCPVRPCPWCGETEKKNIVRPGMNGRYFIDHYDAVFHLQSSVGFDTEAEAVAAWNKMEVRV